MVLGKNRGVGDWYTIYHAIAEGLVSNPSLSRQIGIWDIYDPPLYGWILVVYGWFI